MELNLKKARPHFFAVAAFALITIIYFLPAFQGKTIRQHDMLMASGGAKEVADHRLKTGEEPLWTNSMFSGMPAYQVAIDSPGNLIKPVTIFFTKLFTVNGAIIFVCMLGFYILLLVLRQSPFVAAMGAIAFGFSTYHVGLIQAGHVTKGFAIAYMAPVVAGVLLAYRGRLLAGGALTSLSLALQLTANHLQITYYLLFIILFIGMAQLVSAIIEKRLLFFSKATGVLILASVIAVGPGATIILSTYEYGKESTRGRSELTANAENKTSGLDRDYAVQYSYGKGETFSLLIPNYKGGSSGGIGKSHEDLVEKSNSPYSKYIAQMDSYWGNQPYLASPVYAGAIVVFLFVLGWFVVRGPLKWALLAVTVLGIMLAWGKNLGYTDTDGNLVMPLTDLFLDHVPGYNKFRAVSMMLVIAELAIPLIAFLALGRIIEEPGVLKKKRIFFWIALGATAGLCLLFYLAPTLFQDFFKEGEVDSLEAQLLQAQFPDEQVTVFLNDLQQARIDIFRQDALRSMLFIAAAALLIYLFMKDKVKSIVMLGGIGALMLIDLWAVDKRYLSKEDFVPRSSMEKPFTSSLADKEILTDTSHYRVLNLTVDVFSDASTSYFHKSIGGYHGAKLKRYQEFIEYQLARSISQVVTTLQASPSDSAISATLAAQSPLHMINTKYIIYNPGAPPIQNKYVYGNAWFVSRYNIVSNADEEIAAIGTADLKDEAVIDKRFADELPGLSKVPDPSARIELISYAPNKLAYKSSTKSEQLAVFSEVYYPYGWNAYIDGKQVSHIRANYILRAMRIPAGNHVIEFRFEPEVYATGEKISLISSLIVILLVVGVTVKELKLLSLKKDE